MKVINNITVFEFTDEAAARSYAERCNKPMQILLGDHPYYFVASLTDAERLAALGYEFMPNIQADNHIPAVSTPSM